MTNSPDSGQKRNHFWDAVMAALLTLSLLASAIASTYTTYLNTQQHSLLNNQRQQQDLVELHWQKIDRAETAASDNDHRTCAQVLSEISADSDLYQQVQKLSDKCYATLNREWLANAEAMATENRLKDAINEASNITSGALYAQASDRIKTWSQQIIDLAEKRYLSTTGQFEEAVNIIGRLPESSSLYADSQSLLKQWQQEWYGNQHHYEMAQLAIDRGDLAKADESAQSMSLHPFWTPQQNQILLATEGTRQQLEQIVREAEDLQ